MKNPQLRVRIPADTQQIARIRAAEENMTIGKYIEYLILRDYDIDNEIKASNGLATNGC